VKVSEFLRSWHLSGIVDTSKKDAETELAFWSGWLVSRANHGPICNLDQAREMAIKAAEFIEARARD
jgi:hypothetical protein